MEAIQALFRAGVVTPSYELAPGLFLHAAETASTVVATSTNEDGEAYGVALAALTTGATVPVDAIVILPLSPPLEDEVLDFTFAAASAAAYIQVHDKPQTRMTYGHCLGYSAGAEDRPVAVGSMIKFPSPANFLVAKPRLIAAIRYQMAPEDELDSEAAPAKRACIRQPASLGEQADDTGDKPKGTSNVIIDLDGGRHITRTKADISQREKDLFFGYRAMDLPRQDYAISPDVTLQPEEYRSMLCEQYETQSGHRHEAFAACALVGRVQRLFMFRDRTKLKLLLTGSVLIESTVDPSLSLDDFVSGEKISNKSTACPNQNRGLVAALKNFQMCMHIVFSDAFENCLEVFLDNLEGVYQPMEMVASDLLKFAVEGALRRFFRIIRSVKGTALSFDESVNTPEKCAVFLTRLFDELSTDLSSHQSMTQMDAFFRFRQLRRNEMAAVVKSEAATEPSLAASNGKDGGKQSKGKTAPSSLSAKVKFDSEGAEEKVSASMKACAGFLGGQLGAVRKDGRPYECKFGRECIFRHMSIAGKSNQRLLDLVGGVPASHQADLKKAIAARK